VAIASEKVGSVLTYQRFAGCPRMRLDMFGIDQTDHTEETQQTRCRSQHGLGDALSGVSKPKWARTSWKVVRWAIAR